MCEEQHDKFGESESYGSSSSRTYTYYAGWVAGDGAKPSLGDFIDAPAFKEFKELLRRATRELSVSDFAAMRRFYDVAWLEVLEEL
jgi:hypothetical protein